jgi:hypothetical protein
MIVLGFYEGHSALSKVIKWETRSDISHVSIMQVPDDCLRPHSREILWHRLHKALETCPLWEAWASDGVVRRTGIHDGHKPQTKIHLMRLESEFAFDLDEPAVVAFLEKCVQRGIKYDWWGLVRFMFRIDRNNKIRMFCSELAHIAMHEGRVPLLRRVGAHFVSPADLYRSPLLTELLTVKTKNAVKAPKTRRAPDAGQCPEKTGSKTCNGLQSQIQPVPAIPPHEDALWRFSTPVFPPKAADGSNGHLTRGAVSGNDGAMLKNEGSAQR